MALRAALFLAYVATATADASQAVTHAAPAKSEAHKETKGDKKLQARQGQIEAGRKDVEKGLASMANRHNHLDALAKNDKQIDQLASEIELRVQPALSNQQRKAAEDEYDQQLGNIRNQNMSAPDAQQAVAGYEAAVETNLNLLQDADRKDARSLRQEFSKARRDAHGEVRDMAKSTRKSLHKMGSATGLEMAMQHADKSEHDYDSAEDQLQSEKDTYSDRVDNLHDSLDDTLEDIYSKVNDRVAAKADALEEDARSRRSQLHDALAEAAQTLKLSGSLGRVEKKLHFLEQSVQKNSGFSEEKLTAEESFLVGTNTVCMALIAAGILGSLFMHGRQRAGSRTILQAGLLA
jgi:hypothetical protein